MRIKLQRSIGGAIVGVMALACSGLAQSEEPVHALWKTQEINFIYQGFTTKYTCDGLRDRVREILLELGARPDLKAIAGGCEPSGRPSPFPSVRLVISTPVEATPENLAKLSDAGGRNAGITRPSRKKAAESSPAEQFPASWRTVQLTQLRPKLRLQPGECELIEELRDQVFPKLGIRVVEDHTRCVPHQMSPGQPNTTVAALVSLPQPDIAKAD